MNPCVAFNTANFIWSVLQTSYCLPCLPPALDYSDANPKHHIPPEDKVILIILFQICEAEVYLLLSWIGSKENVI